VKISKSTIEIYALLLEDLDNKKKKTMKEKLYRSESAIFKKDFKKNYFQSFQDA